MPCVALQWWPMRVIVADCSAEYSGRLNASLPLAKRVLLIKADSSLLIFSELGSYKPLNWMTAPCTIREIDPAAKSAQHSRESVAGGAVDGDSATHSPESVAAGEPEKVLRVSADKGSDILEVTLQHIYSDQTYDLGEDPGLIKDGVEDHLQRYLAEQIERIGKGAKLVRREYPTAIGPVDIMAVNAEGEHVAVEIKRHGGIDGVEQLTRYCELLNRDPLLAPVHGHLRRTNHHAASPGLGQRPRLHLPHPRLRRYERHRGRQSQAVLDIAGAPSSEGARYIF